MNGMAGVFFGTCREGATRWGAARSDHRFALRNPIVRIINVAQSFERAPCIKTFAYYFNGLAFFKNAGHCFRAATSGRRIQFALAPGELLKVSLQSDDPLQITGLRIKPLYPLPRRKWAMVNGELSEIRWLQEIIAHNFFFDADALPEFSVANNPR